MLKVHSFMVKSYRVVVVVVAHEIIMSALGLVIAIARARARPRSLTKNRKEIEKKWKRNGKEMEKKWNRNGKEIRMEYQLNTWSLT